MIIISEILQGMFKIIYITYFYKYDNVYIGNGHGHSVNGGKSEASYLV